MISIFAMPGGSQFTVKVPSALDSREKEHFGFFVAADLTKRAKEIPSGGTLVPEMQVASGADVT
jgi:hypothetical protein